MTFYSNLQATADSLLAKFGQTVTITAQTAGAYSPSTGTSAVTTSSQTGRGAVFDYAAGSGEVDGTLVLQGDKKLLLSAVGITAPSVNDTVTANGKTWTVKGVKEINPANSVVMYECNIRGA